MLLKFGRGNAKLDELAKQFECDVLTFSLLSGWTCPFAHECLSKVHVGKNGRRFVVDGPHTKFRCFSASQEALYTNVYESRKHNTDLLKACKSADEMVDLITQSVPKIDIPKIIRIHVAGDFYNPTYFDAWVEFARQHYWILCYAYTKSLPYWVQRQKDLPENFVLTASYGGRKDEMIIEHMLRYAKVVFSEKEAENLGLEIDHDDTHAADMETRDKSFALLIHGSQPKGSDAGKAVRALKGKGSYRRGKK